MAINIHSVILAVKMAFKKSKDYTDQKTSGLAGGINYKGSVSYYSSLPNNPEDGDAYTVKYAGDSGTTPDGTEYVWGYDTDLQTMAWIDWSKDSYTKAQTDAIINPVSEQVELNKNNISSNWGAKNLLVNRGSLSNDNITYTWVNGDVSVTGNKVGESATYVTVMPPTPLSDLGLSDKVVISNNGTNCLLSVILISSISGTTSITEIVSGSNIIDVPSGFTHIMVRLGIKEGVRGTINETIQPMICTKAQWDISHEYQPYPFSNAELTAAGILINDILSRVIVLQGYTLESASNLWQQGKHIWGQLIFKVDTGYIPTTATTIALMPSAALVPKREIISSCYAGSSESDVRNIAYFNFTLMGTMEVTAYEATNTHINIQLNYTTA